MYSKVDGYSHLIRDEKTKAVLNTNSSEYESYLKIKNSKNTTNKKIESLEKDFLNIKEDINEIKNLLKKITGSV